MILSVLLEGVKSCISCLFLTNMNFSIPQLVLTRKAFDLWAPLLLDVFPTSWVTGNKKVLNYGLQRSAPLGLWEMHQVSSIANNIRFSCGVPTLCCLFQDIYALALVWLVILPRAFFAHRYVPHSFFFVLHFKLFLLQQQMDHCRPSFLAVQFSHHASTF